MEEDENTILSSILGFAVGDALGVPAEFKKRDELKNKPVFNMEAFGSHNQPAGTWSDDTSMVIATMDSIIEKDEIDYNDIMQKYSQWYKNAQYTPNNVVFDIGNGTRNAIENYLKGTKAVNCGSSIYYNNGNGSLMRMIPIVLYCIFNNYSERQEVETIYYYSSLTHANEISLMGCKIYYDFVKALMELKDPKEALAKLSSYDYEKYYDCSYLYNRILSGKIANLEESDIQSSGYILDTLEAVIWCILKTNSYKEAVLKAINLGDDTDTIGALTGAIAGILYGLDDIPQEWISTLQKSDELVKVTADFAMSLSKKKLTK